MGRLRLYSAITLVFLTFFTLVAQASDEPVCKDGVICLDQGWTDEQRNWWYTASQGSRLLPLSWMRALETETSTAENPMRFLDESNIRQLGYLPNRVTRDNPYGLPIGFVVDHDDSRGADIMCDTFPSTCDGFLMREEWIGLNCSACHTSEIELSEGTAVRRLRIEGAPSLADFQQLEETLLRALKVTRDDAARFDRFARMVLGGQITVERREMLKAQLDEHITWQAALENKNAAPVRYGQGRLDAQGHILNKVALALGIPDQLDNIRADAPASYPFIWNTSQQDKIQWNGIANNVATIPIFGRATDLGALVRNTSEVIGVFAHLDAKRGKAFRGYDSSLRLRNMVALERQLAGLKSPRWPEDLLGPIDWELAGQGKPLFDQMCISCHKPLAWDDLSSPIKSVMTPLAKSGTDVFLACNTWLHRSKSGNLAGQKIFAFTGDRIAQTDFTRNLLVNSTVGVIMGQADELFLTLFTDVAPTGVPEIAIGAVDDRDFLPGVTNQAKKAQAKTCLTDEDELLAYKTRPLNGIWATAPYLHNGSVPTLYDLLLPSSLRLIGDGEVAASGALPLRPEVFGVGSRKFDVTKVGFDSNPETSPFVFRVRDAATNEPIPGNYNSGHDYGTSRLSDSDRQALVEYLKTL